MADSEQEINGSSDKNSSQPSEKDSQEDVNLEMSGWLMKRTRISHKWKKKWFHLKNTELLYGDTDEVAPKKKIPLQSAEITESIVDHKDNAFRIRPKDSKRVFYMYAENNQDQHNWMQAICFAKATGRTGGESEACVLQ